MARIGRDRMSVFIIASVGFHLALAGAFTFVKPLREAVFGERAAKPAQIISGDELRPVAKARRQQTTAAIKRYDQQLQDLVKQMAALRDPQLAKVAQVKNKAAADDIKARLRYRLPPAPAAAQPAGPDGDEGIGAAWQHLRQTESTLVDTYEQLRAARLAQGDEEIVSAVRLARVERPSRREVNQTLITTRFANSLDPQIDAFKKELDGLEDDARNMVAFGTKLLDTARYGEKLEEDRGVTISTAVVSGSDASLGGDVGPTLMPDEMFKSDITFSTGNFGAVSSRRITSDGKGSQWIYVGDWYICGPFANEGRRNLNTRFMPEVGVDLDATYIGKNGRKVSWVWRRSPRPMIQPEHTDNYAVWYCASELYSDRDRDLMVALGSDDFGKLWVNDKLVWASPETPKPYNAAEHMEVVHFNKGFNKLLFRLENGGGATGFSVIINTTDVKGAN